MLQSKPKRTSSEFSKNITKKEQHQFTLAQIHALSQHESSAGKNQKGKDELIHKSRQLSIKYPPFGGLANKQNSREFISEIKIINVEKGYKGEEKSKMIEKQKEEIQILKKYVTDIKGTYEKQAQQRQRMRNQELTKLKKLQSDQRQNLKQLNSLRYHLTDIKAKYQKNLLDKANIFFKYNDTLEQNKNLTLTIVQLKEDLQKSRINNTMITQNEKLQQQIQQSMIHRQSLQNRCYNFEKKMNEYLLKFNELQESHNEYQIKYYKLQKQCDNFKVDKEEANQLALNLSQKITAERETYVLEVNKLKERLKIKDNELAQFKNKINSINEVEIISKKQNYQENIFLLNQRNNQLKNSFDVEVKKWEKYVKELTRQFNQEKYDYKLKIDEQNKKYIDQFVSIKENLNNLQRQLENKHAQMNHLHHQMQEIQINKEKLQQTLSQKQESIKEIQQFNQILVKENELKSKKQQQVMKKITIFQTQLHQAKDYLNKQNQILHSQNRSLLQMLQIKDSQLKQNCKKIIQKDNQIIKMKQEIQGLSKKERKSYQILIEKQQQICLREQYQTKYEKQLEQYNNLSLEFKQISEQNASILTEKTKYTTEVNNLRFQVQILKSNIESLKKDHLSKLQIAQQNLKEKQFEERQALTKDLQLKNNMLTHFQHIIQSKQQQICSIRQQITKQLCQIKQLRAKTQIYETRYDQLVRKYQEELSEWQKCRSSWKNYEQQDKEMHELQSSRLTYSLDQSQMTIEVLRKENEELQRIFSQEIQKRNNTIRQLIREKKNLFDQLMHKQAYCN